MTNAVFHAGFGRNLREWVERLNTLPLQQGRTPTRALIVFNEGNVSLSGRVRFAAAFPMRRESCPRPVIVRDSEGIVVPSRLTVSDVEEHSDLQPGRVLWRMELEFIATAVPAEGWRTYGTTFGCPDESGSEDAAFFDVLPLLPLLVLETECHAGDLPLVGTI